MNDGQNTGESTEQAVNTAGQRDLNDCQTNAYSLQECVDVGPHITQPYVVSPPGQIKIPSVTHDAVFLSWDPPEGLTESLRFRVTWKCESTGDLLCSEVPVPNICIQGLTPGMKYEFTVATISDSGRQSKSVSTTRTTDVLEPKELKTEVTTTSARLSWTLPYEMDLTSHSFCISYSSTGKDKEFISTSSYCTVITGLQPDTKYTVNVSIVCHSGICQPATTTFRTNGVERPSEDKQHTTSTSEELLPPRQINITSVAHDAVSLSWKPPEGRTKSLKFRVTWKSEREGDLYRSEVPVAKLRIQGLTPGVKYEFTVVTISDSGGQSTSVSTTQTTGVLMPKELSVQKVTTKSARLRWTLPYEMKLTPHRFLISYSSAQCKDQKYISTPSYSTFIRGLQPDTKYTVNVSVECQNSGSCKPASTTIHTNGDERSSKHEQHSTASASEDGDEMHFEDKQHSTTSTSEGKTYYTLALGKSAEHSRGIKTWLKHLTGVESVQSCDMILATCVVVSRVGTDVEAALKDITDAKPTILVVLHHTFDPDHVIPDSSRFNKRDDMLIVDCLFNEDGGLLRCERNDTAQSKMLKWINAKVSGPKVSLFGRLSRGVTAGW